MDDEDGFVVVLIGNQQFAPNVCAALSNKYQDEVESLTAARAGAMAGTEPSDGLRVGLGYLFDLNVC